MIIHDHGQERTGNTQFKDYKPDITIEENEYIVVEFPNGSQVFLRADHFGDGGVGLFIYDDPPSMMPVLSYNQRNWKKN